MPRVHIHTVGEDTDLGALRPLRVEVWGDALARAAKEIAVLACDERTTGRGWIDPPK